MKENDVVYATFLKCRDDANTWLTDYRRRLDECQKQALDEQLASLQVEIIVHVKYSSLNYSRKC
jgi:hypothetical protein